MLFRALARYYYTIIQNNDHIFHNHVSISIIKKKKKKNVYKKKKNKTFLLTKNFYHLPFRSFLSRWRVGSESDQNSLKRETKEIELIIEECVYHILREINISAWKFHFDMEKCLGYKAAVLFHKRPIERKITHAYRNSRWLSKRRTVTGSLSSLTLGPSPEIILAYPVCHFPNESQLVTKQLPTICFHICKGSRNFESRAFDA